MPRDRATLIHVVAHEPRTRCTHARMLRARTERELHDSTQTRVAPWLHSVDP